MKVETSKLTGIALDWVVAKAEGEDFIAVSGVNGIGMEYEATRYSTDWAQGGPIIDREDIGLLGKSDLFPEPQLAVHPKDGAVFWGSTKLIAAMRCFVANKLGDEVDVPDVLLNSSK